MNLNDLVATIREGRALGPKGALRFDELIVTWKSVLFIGDDIVLKVARPLDVDGENRTMLGARRLVATRERNIGRRISPLVYLGDTSFVPTPDGGIELKVDAEAGEPVVAMRRLPNADRLDVRLSDPGFGPDQMSVLMKQLVEFHGDAPFERLQLGHGRPGRALSRWQDAVAALGDATVALGPEAPVPQVDLQALLHAGQERFASRDALFAQRVAEGRVRDIHGALQLNHIFIPPTGHKARILDPADGPEEERYIDTAEEIAGLALEVGLVRSSSFVEHLVSLYAEGAADKTLPKVLDLYAALVAVKRAGRALREAAIEGPDSPAFGRARVFVEAAEALIERVPVEPVVDAKRISLP